MMQEEMQRMNAETFNKTLPVLGALALLTAGTAAAGGEATEADAGKAKATPCLSCHDIGNFTGQDAQELIAAMQGMKSGELSHLPLPSTLTDDDIAAIAAYLSGAANE
jgi:cytochrome c553